ncbi:MAG: threonylcarbamoyl-AMP synthase [bacterium]|nr:threonylcarbamoyl-AMP synthase [bacterium]
MKIFKKEDLNEIVKRLQNFEVGILPTDTIYGLSGIATSEKVKQRIYELKERSFVKQLVLQVGTNYNISKLVIINDLAEKLMSAFWPGALTLIFKVNPKFDWEIDTLALRIPRHKLLIEILNKLNDPLFVTSCNKSGVDPIADPYFFDYKVDFYLDDEKDYDFFPSTIVDISEGKLNVIREGVISKNKIWEVL